MLEVYLQYCDDIKYCDINNFLLKLRINTNKELKYCDINKIFAKTKNLVGENTKALMIKRIIIHS